MEQLALLVTQAIGDRPFREAAERCELPLMTLFNIANAKTKRPSPEVLLSIERGLGVSYRALALAAYGMVDPPAADAQGDGVTASDGPPPSDTEESWTQQPDRKRRFAAIS